MDGYVLISLNDLYQQCGEDGTKTILSDFSCPLNLDVEQFLHKSALEFAKQSIAKTHLVFAQYQNVPVLIGYFTLALKYIVVTKRHVSSTCYKKICKFGTYSPDMKGCVIPAPLIAQLGKNFKNGYNHLISGDELLKMACDKIAMFQQELGGKIVYLECEDKPQLLDFYQENGFVQFNKRLMDRDETDVMDGRYLIQLLKIIKA